ncbi:MAG: hypothetical protein PF590_04900 [Candidatus Delongbacteria bacterium]|nr:hypothetical protein [Candidatus Delongbacteria bacterium]
MFVFWQKPPVEAYYYGHVTTLPTHTHGIMGDLTGGWVDVCQVINYSLITA